MVDAVVSFVVERLGDYLIQEAVFLQGVRSEVKSLKKELEWMLCFIKDAENKQVDHALIRQWVSDIQEIAYDSEDVLDKFMVEVQDEKSLNMRKVDEGETSKRRQRLFTSIKKCSCFCSKGKEKISLYSIGKEIEELKTRLGDVARRCQLYGLENINNKSEGKIMAVGRLKQVRRTTSFALQENVVGFEDEISILLDKLLENELQRLVISIWGTGGLGKTTLASKLYHNDAVKNKFDRCAWVSMSQDYNTRDLLLRIIKSFNIENTVEELEKMNQEDLERYLFRSLQEYSYLVVIDDVWKKESWQSLRRAFPDNKKGSRVIITTRMREVAKRSDERTYVHALRFLSPDESWQLFCEKAFQNFNADQRLEKLGREMVEKCSGLPLAIVVLGGLLSTKKPQEWHLVRNHIWRDLSNDSIQISYLLALSLNDLPYHVKLCFLYLGQFPEDTEIDTEKLIRLWVAEGFIPDDEEMMEDVANNNLNELINRSLIKIGRISWRRILTCRVHDLLRDLAIQKAKELNFFYIYDEIKSSIRPSRLSSCRRQSVYHGIESGVWLQQYNSHLRSLLLFNLHHMAPTILQHLPTVCTSFRLLRILDLEDCAIGSSNGKLPDEIGKLIHLKYLGLRNSNIDHLPPSILNLLSLQTLDLRGNSLSQVPTEICKLKELRHLIGNFQGQYLRIDNMTNLQTLKYIQDDTWTKTNPEKLVNLRELHISLYHVEQKEFTFDSIAKLKSLRILSVELSRKHFFASLQPLSQCQYLQDLSLYGKIEKLPGDMHQLLPNLERLSLEDSRLVDDPMPTLEKLLNLTVLDLSMDSYCGKKLVCTAKGFSRLEILIIHVENLEEWRVEEGAMPMLRGLSISEDLKLRIPERLSSIPLPVEWE